ncbi:hypothetical protein RhiJN_17355 [Ceratobasidium sp. AG-Ba]|nr:hypothetical protein RhiJN_17355 [Ceratobasidium sp. AG-Ba]
MKGSSGNSHQVSNMQSSQRIKPSTGVTSTAFTRRTGYYRFPEPTKTNRCAHMVDNWHLEISGGQAIIYRYEQQGPIQKPTWLAIPIILGEEHPQYSGFGLSKMLAQEDSAKNIINSGHC